MKKTLTKLCLLAIISFVGINLCAQDNPVTWGLKGGLNLSSLSDDFSDGDVKAGVNIGVTADIAVAPNFFLLSGLEFTTKGTKGDGVTLNLSYLQIPLHVGYKLDVNEATKLVFGLGPYIAYGVDGSWKYQGVSLDTFGDDAILKMKRFDFGLGLSAGVEFGKLVANIGYDFGLANICDFGDGIVIDGFGELNRDLKTKNANTYLTIGYKF